MGLLYSPKLLVAGFDVYTIGYFYLMIYLYGCLSGLLLADLSRLENSFIFDLKSARSIFTWIVLYFWFIVYSLLDPSNTMLLAYIHAVFTFAVQYIIIQVWRDYTPAVTKTEKKLLTLAINFFWLVELLVILNVANS